MNNKVKEIVTDWFAGGEVDCFLGYKLNNRGIPVPGQFKKKDDLQEFFFGNGCFHNLALYVNPGTEKKTALIVKGCDSRALVQLIAEGYLKRDKLLIIGTSCPCMNTADNSSLPKCRYCTERSPALYDKWIDNPAGSPVINILSAGQELRDIEAFSPEEKAQFFDRLFAKCIRCYACRQVCPLCCCEECITEHDTPGWIDTAITPASNKYWGLIRTYHLAGRCILCGECERVCPVHIPLGLLHSKMKNEIEKKFGYRAGKDINAKPVLFDFTDDKDHH